MILRRFNVMLAVGLACAGLPGPSSALVAQPASCQRPVYPNEALRRGEDGVVVLGFLVRTDGTVAQSLVLSSTGSADLDRTARDALSKCLFGRMGSAGVATEHWQSVAYTWTLEDDPELKRAKREAGLAAKAGNAAAYYRLSLLLAQTAKTDADRQRAFAVLRGAAERGHPHAQYQLGMRYEQGDGVAADRDEAQKWYEAAAKQDDVFALQRLKLGKLVEPIDR
jgi:TonB family protein